MSQAPLALQSHNPDVLNCIANLSNDEVFTPPELANHVLDSLGSAWARANDGEDIWANAGLRFLDPFTKSGVFLREITRRLTDGLATEIPDLKARVDHILANQVFGVAITELTGLLARRSLYCSKFANGKHSISRSLSSLDGNVWFERTGHTWDGAKCRYCGAPKKIFERSSELESHAYAFIHTDNVQARLEEMFGGPMKFDVVVGNPPYQMTGGAGGSSDSSIYHLFVDQARRLNPEFIAMVVPSRWLAGGRGLGEFREEMLGSHQLLELVDYPVSKEVFPSVEVKGGICYFLWSTHHDGDCEVTVNRGRVSRSATRQLDEFDVFVRDPRSADILRKVLAEGEASITDVLTADTPFGLATNFDGFTKDGGPEDLALHYVRRGKRGIGFMPRSEIRKNIHLIDQWKVLAPKAGSDGGQKIPDSVLGKPWVSAPPSAATQTFLAFCVESEEEARSLESYYRTKFFRHLVSLRKLTQDALRPMYVWVPIQAWDRTWTDEELYGKYRLTEDEIAHIEAVIKPMESADG